MVFEREYDVLIGGGGVAGAAAAMQCARAGLKTALVEKTILFGGLATAGLVNWYVPLCDGHGHQVIFGIAEEFLHASLKYGPGQVPAGWYDPSLAAKGRMRRYNALFSPASLVMGLDELLEERGVTVWLGYLDHRTHHAGRSGKRRGGGDQGRTGLAARQVPGGCHRGRRHRHPGRCGNL